MSRGLTLVELIVTITLAAIIGAPAGRLVSEHLRAALRGRDMTLAINLARYEEERLDGLNDFFAAPDLNVTTTDFASYQGYPYTLRRTVDCVLGNCVSAVQSSQGVKRITLQVYKPSGANPTAELLATVVTYRAKHVLFGS